MKRFVSGFVFLMGLVLVLLLIAPQTSAENPRFETFSGFMTNDPTQTQVGDFWFDGGGNLHRRGWYFGFDMISSDDRFNGATVVDELNGNWLANQMFDGKMWGKFWIYQQDGGIWEGSWTGKVVGGQQFVTGVAKGIGGTIDGMKLKMTAIQQPASSPSVFDISGEIH